MKTDIEKMSDILGQQAKYHIKNPDVYSDDIDDAWSGVALPLVRRAFASLPLNIVSVQPMTASSGVKYTLLD